MPFAIAISKAESGARLLALEGKLTVGDACESLRDAVRRELELGNRAIVLDMQKLSYIDSSGLGTLVSVLMAARREQGDLAVTNVPPRVRDLLHVCRVDTIIQLLEESVPHADSKGTA